MMIRRLLDLVLAVASAFRRILTRRFTAAGIFVLTGLIASAIVGLDTNLTVAYQVFTYLFFLIVFAVFFGLWFPTRFSARRILPRFATVNESVTYAIVVRNETKRSQNGLFLIEHHPVSRLVLEKDGTDKYPGILGWLQRKIGRLNEGEDALIKEIVIQTLLPSTDLEVHAEIIPQKRGHLWLSGIRIGGTDPMGLYKSFTTIAASQSLLILPKRYSLQPIALPGTRRYQSSGVSLAASVGDSEEFISLRDYRPGDPLRRIYWRGFAKTDRPIVKEYQEEFFVRHALVLDTFQKVGGEAVFEEAVSIAASFACSIDTQESLLDLLFVGTEAYCFTSGRGIAHTDRMLEILASVQPCRGKPFSTLTPLVLGRAALLSGCICIMIAWDEERKSLVTRLKALGIPLLVLVVSDDAEHPVIETEYAGTVQVLKAGKIGEGLADL